MNVTPYLALSGQCERALDFYAAVFNGKITTKMLFSEMPGDNPFPPEMQDKVMHATMQAPDITIMATDQTAQGAKGNTPLITISLNFDTIDQARPIFDALAEGGNITMPLGKTFFSPGFGMCNDQFGIAWMVNAEEG